MLITIITVTYNAQEHICKTIESILNQTNKDFEYIVIDGNSKDKTVDILRKYTEKIEQKEFQLHDFKWISEPDTGLYDAMNKGLDMATGEFVWFMNAGDKLFDNNTLAEIQNHLQSNPDADIVYGQSLIIDQNDTPIGERHKIAPKKLTVNSFLNGLVVGHQSILVRKSIATHYDLQYTVAADYDWVISAVKKSHQNLYIDNYLSRFMIAGFSTVHRKKAWKDRFLIMKKQFGLCKTLWAHFLITLKYPFTKKYYLLLIAFIGSWW
ncbi:MAG: glycosyltransferase [Bacteroidales bacterium]|jgi:glycosyltransferase involved in cell wall biosynthesis|nr:glycosyltransferase [Bacteroidales bacterium]